MLSSAVAASLKPLVPVTNREPSMSTGRPVEKVPVVGLIRSVPSRASLLVTSIDFVSTIGLPTFVENATPTVPSGLLLVTPTPSCTAFASEPVPEEAALATTNVTIPEVVRSIVSPTPAFGVATTMMLFEPARSVTSPEAERPTPPGVPRNTAFVPSTVRSTSEARVVSVSVPTAEAVAELAFTVAVTSPPEDASDTTPDVMSAVEPFDVPSMPPVDESVTLSPSAKMLLAPSEIFLRVPDAVSDTFLPEPIAFTLATVTSSSLVTATPPFDASTEVSATALPDCTTAMSPAPLVAAIVAAFVATMMPVVADSDRSSALIAPLWAVLWMNPLATLSDTSSAPPPATIPVAPTLKLLSLRIVIAPPAVDAVTVSADVSMSMTFPASSSVRSTALPTIDWPPASSEPLVSVSDTVPPAALIPADPTVSPSDSVIVMPPERLVADSDTTSVLRFRPSVADTYAISASSVPTPDRIAPVTSSVTVAPAPATMPADASDTFPAWLIEISPAVEATSSNPADVANVMPVAARSFRRFPLADAVSNAASALAALSRPLVATLP